MEKLAQEAAERGRGDPEWFFRSILGIEPWEKQVEIPKAILAHEKTLVHSCVASGKTFTASAVMAWWLLTRYPARVFTIAPTERQLKINVWGEFNRLHPSSRVPLGGDLVTLSWKLGENWYAKGFSPKDGLSVFGIHGPNDLVLFDDAQGITADVIDAFENASAGGTTKYLFLCNPTMVTGPLYEAITGRRHEMHAIQIDAYCTPNVQAGRVVVPGLITREKVEEWIKKYGWDSDFVRTKVRALPPKQEPDTLIPIDWLELARVRVVPQDAGVREAGQDVARFGDDLSVFMARCGRQLLPPEEGDVLTGNDTMQVTGRMVAAAKSRRVARVNVDEIGIGAGVVDRAHEVRKEQGLTVDFAGVNVAEKAHDEKRFVNLRSEIWWCARESLDPKNGNAMSITGCPDEVIADLSGMKYRLRSDGRIEVESKEDTKKRLGRSPDYGDAYALCVFRGYMEGMAPAVAFENKTNLPRRPTWL